MRKELLNLLVWAVAVILLFIIWVSGNNGFRGQAIAGIVVLVAMMVLWNRRTSPQIPRTNRATETGEALTIPENRKAKFYFIRILSMGQWGLWIVGLGIGAGVFGKSPYLTYLFLAIVVIAVAISLFMRSIGQKADNST
jgi:hypothetical protein